MNDLKILITAAYNTGHFSPFVVEQAKSLQKLGVEIEFFGIEGKGLLGYLKNRKQLIRKIKEFQPDIIHAHYGLSGLLANLQRKVPVVTTFHGSDIHSGGVILFLSRMAMHLSKYNIFVSNGLYKIAKYKKKNYIVTACGTDVAKVFPVDRQQARAALNWSDDKKYILFSGAFTNPIKNALLAQEAVKLVENATLIELKGYTREEVNLLLNACDVQLTTSIRESGPLIVKEAMACGCPVVSVDVGDVKEIIGDMQGYYIADRTPESIAKKLQQVLVLNMRTTGRERILELGLDAETVAKRILKIYERVAK